MNALCRLSSVLIALALGACATGPAFQAPERAPADRAQLYVYRPMVLAGGGTSHRVSIDGQGQPLSLPNASSQRVVLPPGTHTLEIRDVFGVLTCNPAPLRLSLVPGQTMYVADVVGTTQGLNRLYVGCSAVERDERQALGELAGLKAAE